MTDPLAEMLRSIHLTGGVFLEAHFTAPWCVLAKITAEDCRPFRMTPAEVIAYHFVIAGRLLLTVDGEPATEVRAGEIVLLPHNDVHTLASAAGLEPVSGRALIQQSADGGLARIVHGGGGEAAQLVCGFLGCEDRDDPLIAALPKIMQLDVSEGTSRDWIEASVRHAAGELAAGRLASSSVMSRLSELLLVEAVRRFASTFPTEAVGWLPGLRDPQVGRALALIHGQVDAPWSADSLAREVALSRSAFMARFKTLVGVPPIRYLTLRRLQTAKRQLHDSTLSVGQLAHAVGYESEAAFSRAFKREFGLSPARWRDTGPRD